MSINSLSARALLRPYFQKPRQQIPLASIREAVNLFLTKLSGIGANAIHNRRKGVPLKTYSRRFVLPALVSASLCLLISPGTPLGAGKKPKTAGVSSSDAAIQPVRTSLSFSDSLEHPFIWLTNESLAVKVYLPDRERGYYRGTRFNWSGMVGEVRYKGHRYFQHWQLKKHDPLHPEHAIGPADEFDMQNPPLYDKAQEGERFVKIGVGTLIKSDVRPSYFFNHSYAIADTGKWDVTVGSHTIDFNQKLNYRSVGYEYTKKLVLARNQLQIHHELKNTGSENLSSENYCHNFVIIDGDTAGPSYRVAFGVKPQPKEKHLNQIVNLGATLEEKTLSFTKTYPGTSIFFNLAQPAEHESKTLATITNIRTGGKVTVGADPAPDRFVFWSSFPLCPEPFVQIDLEPGESTSWVTSLSFSSTPKDTVK